MKSYIEFLKDKVIKAPVSGIEVSPADISSVLKPHQRDAVLWALKGGRRALFEAFGLGKSIQQLEWCHVLTKKIGGKALIVCPLGVKQEFAEDAVHLLNIPAPTYVRNMEEVKAEDNRILITNYERIRDGDIDPHYFTACSLDEASVLRSFGSKTYQTFLPKFKGVKYKLVATATPAPNRYKGYRKWQKLVYGMIPCKIGRAIVAITVIIGVVTLAALITLLTTPLILIKTIIKKVYEDGAKEIIMAMEFERIKNGYEQYIKDIGGIQ